jgi:hypothetical protein
MEHVCANHSGLKADIDNIKEETVKQGTAIDKMDAKLNMIIGAIILSPFLWSVLAGIVRTAQAGG